MALRERGRCRCGGLVRTGSQRLVASGRRLRALLWGAVFAHSLTSFLAKRFVALLPALLVSLRRLAADRTVALRRRVVPALAVVSSFRHCAMSLPSRVTPCLLERGAALHPPRPVAHAEGAEPAPHAA